MEWIIVIILGAFAFAIILSWLKTAKDALNGHTELKKQHQITLSEIYNEKKELKNRITDLEEKLKSEKTINRIGQKYTEKQYVYTPFEKFRIMRLKRDLEQEAAELKVIYDLLKCDLTEDDLEKVESSEKEIMDKRAKD